MGRNRFVNPEQVRYPLSDGDWVEIKKKLNYGDDLALQSAGFTGINASALSGADIEEAEAKVDMRRWMLENLATWLVDWSFKDDQDRPVKLSKAAIANLDSDTAAEIMAVINKHAADMQEEKKLMLGKLEVKTSAT